MVTHVRQTAAAFVDINPLFPLSHPLNLKLVGNNFVCPSSVQYLHIPSHFGDETLPWSLFPMQQCLGAERFCFITCSACFTSVSLDNGKYPQHLPRLVQQTQAGLTLEAAASSSVAQRER